MATKKTEKAKTPETRKSRVSVYPKRSVEDELPQIQLALPAASSSSGRVSGVVESGQVQGLSFSEALTKYEVGANTLRRWLQEGSLKGAARVATSKGEAYRIPEEALLAKGLKVREGAVAGAELEETRSKLAVAEARIKALEEVKLEAERRNELLRLEAENARLKATNAEEKVVILSEAQSDLRKALLILESSQQKKARFGRNKN